MPAQIHSFAPVVDADTRVLILGSMPGKESLRLQQFYGHPRNLFWRLMAEILGVDKEGPYEKRIAQLLGKGVGLWDVLQTCTRETSLDSDIVESSIVPNDFAGLLESHPSIHTICFNGKKAGKSFAKHVQPGLENAREIVFHDLPSTSPANASIAFEKKLAVK